MLKPLRSKAHQYRESSQGKPPRIRRIPAKRWNVFSAKYSYLQGSLEKQKMNKKQITKQESIYNIFIYIYIMLYIQYICIYII